MHTILGVSTTGGKLNFNIWSSFQNLLILLTKMCLTCTLNKKIATTCVVLQGLNFVVSTHTHLIRWIILYCIDDVLLWMSISRSKKISVSKEKEYKENNAWDAIEFPSFVKERTMWNEKCWFGCTFWLEEFSKKKKMRHRELKTRCKKKTF